MEYLKTENGKRSDRPQLEAALKHARAIGARLVFAKLDRLNSLTSRPERWAAYQSSTVSGEADELSSIRAFRSPEEDQKAAADPTEILPCSSLPPRPDVLFFASRSPGLRAPRLG
jgi:hypothetical protein